MRITWVTRSFLDYRIPVYAALDELCRHQLTLIYNDEVTSESLRGKVKGVLGDRAIGLTGELRLATTRKKNVTTGFANKGIRIPFQPGLIAKLNDSMPEVMISDGFMQWTYATLWQRFWHGIPHVMCYERTAYTERKCQWYRRIYRKLAMRYIDSYCANGKLCGDYLVSLGADKDRISYGHMVADTQGLALAVSKIQEQCVCEIYSKYCITGQMFLYVGQLIERKGLLQLLKAWNQAHLPNATLVLVGEGSEKETLQTYSRQNNLNVVFTGRINYDSIAPFYKSANIFVIPTLEDNWSLVVPEAMACGLPILCSCYNGCYPELVKTENGIVFDPLDATDTTSALKNMNDKSDKELMEMGLQSRTIINDFTPSTAAQNIYHACNTALKAVQKSK